MYISARISQDTRYFFYKHVKIWKKKTFTENRHVLYNQYIFFY